MSKDPAYLMYAKDFNAGTQKLNLEEIGMLVLLMNEQHIEGPLSLETIKRVLRNHDPSEYLIENFFKKTQDNKYFNNRMIKESEKRKNYSESRRNNRLGKTKDHMLNTSKTYVNHMVNANENVDVNKNEDETKQYIRPDFTEFWDLYDKKVSPKKCKMKWDKLPYKTKVEIIEYIPKYKSAQPDKQYRKNPEVFLNKQGWLDEIIYNNSLNENNKKRAKYSNEFLEEIQRGANEQVFKEI